MRPDKLTPLFADSANLKGVGPRVAKLLENLCGSRIIDLIFHLPTSAIDRYNAPDLNDAISGTIVTLTITILKHRPAPSKKAPYRIDCQSDQGFLSLVFFHAPKDWLNKNYPEDGTRVISGKLEAFRDGWQITHPDYVVTEDNVWQIPKIEPVYPLTGGLSLKQLLRFVGESVKKAPELAEWIDSSLLKKQEWPTWQNRAFGCTQTDLTCRGYSSFFIKTATSLRRTLGRAISSVSCQNTSEQASWQKHQNRDTF